MKRVQVNMKGGLRGQVEEFSNDEGLSMPQAYAQLLRYGLQHYRESKSKEGQENGEMVEAQEESEVSEA